MRALIQRVNYSKVIINGKVKSEIGYGLLILLGVENEDAEGDASWLASKVTGLRIFDDADGVMNMSVKDIGGDVMVISQFTLHANTKKGTRPSYIRAAKPDISVPLYEHFIQQIGNESGKEIATGEFGAHMKIDMENDGPVTLMIDSKNKNL